MVNLIGLCVLILAGPHAGKRGKARKVFMNKIMVDYQDEVGMPYGLATLNFSTLVPPNDLKKCD